MADHDSSYKLLFGEPAMVRDLLLEFVKEEWVDQLDFSTLEKVSGSYVTDDLRDREDDIIWRVRWGEGWLYVYLLIEFQSSVDRFMAVRVMAYEALLYQDLIRQKAFTPGGKLPPVLPIVLYNGENRWTAAQDVAELVEAIPGGLSHYRPSLSYLLLDEGEICQNEDGLEETRNLAVALFQLEHGQDEQRWTEVLERLVVWLQAPEHASMRRAFTVWIKRVLIPGRLPGIDPAKVSSLQDLQEVHTMLAERIKEWPEKWKRQGLEEGRQKGRQEGRQEGLHEGRLEAARNMLKRTSMDDQMISELSELDIEQVRKLREGLQN